MWRCVVNVMVVLHCMGSVYTQRVAPGVPPQQYQQYQQGHPQHNAPVQHHQVPVQPQYQQQPQVQQNYQQQQQFQQQQQQQQHQQHVNQSPPPPPPQQPQQHQQHPQHHQGHHNPQLLNPENIAHEKEHIAEHMDVPIDTSKMSEQELQFHYFKMHDSDNNNMLDGCELIKSLIHWHDKESNVDDKTSKADDVLESTVDGILDLADINKDGYIDYPEFRNIQNTQEQETEKH